MKTLPCLLALIFSFVLMSCSPGFRTVTKGDRTYISLQHIAFGRFYLPWPEGNPEKEKMLYGEEMPNAAFNHVEGNDFIPGQLSIAIPENDTLRYTEGYMARRIYVVNRSSDTIFFEGHDYRVHMKLQAKDWHGTWRDIEWLPLSGCGHSYHTLWLPPESYWSFKMPVYYGMYKTQLRAQLEYEFPLYEKHILYSQAFEGRINPGQFMNRE